MSTLLQQAKKSVKKSRFSVKITPEVMELAVAWARAEVSTSQAEESLIEAGIVSTGMGVYCVFARALREYFREKGL
jgi:hypothetical protein